MIFDPTARGAFAAIKQRVDEETLENASGICKVDYSFYNPWLCHLSPNKKHTCLNPVYQHVYKAGSLLTDKSSLTELIGFLKMEGKNIWDKSEEKTGISSQRNKSVTISKQISDKELGFFIQCKNEAFRFSPFFDSFNTVVNVLIPVNDPGFESYSYSSILSRGAIFIALPISKPLGHLQFQISLIHELGHQLLYLVQCSDTLLIKQAMLTPVWSGIRQQFRPAIKAFHGLVALAFSLNFSRRRMSFSDVSIEEKDYLVSLQKDFVLKVNETLEALKQHNEFTEVGAQVFSELRDLALQDP